MFLCVERSASQKLFQKELCMPCLQRIKIITIFILVSSRCKSKTGLILRFRRKGKMIFLKGEQPLFLHLA